MRAVRVSAFLALSAAAGLLALGACASRGAKQESERVADPSSAREISTGKLVGFASSPDTFGWLGIPFARPPVGELRWRAPQPPEPWTGERQALAIGSACPQLANALGDAPGADRGSVIGSEDCLYLNVYAPRGGAVQDARPVMVWIHGGGNTIGHGGFYDGSKLAAAHDLVVVTVNYRLGPFGWFRHPALIAASNDAADRSGNFGTLDLVRALEWVRDNISVFGGDRSNVTIFGESAGATDVLSLLASPRASRLFHRAISQSGGTYSSSLAEAQNLRDASEPGAENSSQEAALRMLYGKRASDARAEVLAELSARTPQSVAAALRAETPEGVLGAYLSGDSTLGMLRLPTVIRDGHVLPEPEIPELLSSGRYNRVPVMLGTNRDETKLFQFLDPEQVWKLFWVLPRPRDAQDYQVSSEYGSRAWRLRGADQPARELRASRNPNVYVYRFDWDEEPTFLGSDLGLLLGAAHGMEIPFVFGSFSTSFFGRVFTEPNRPGREELSRAMMSYWAQFAYTGDPGSGRDGTLARWKAWDESSPDADKFVVLDSPAGGGIAMSNDELTHPGLLAQLASDPRLETEEDRCKLFDSLVRWSNLDAEDHAAAGCPSYGETDVAAR